MPTAKEYFEKDSSKNLRVEVTQSVAVDKDKPLSVRVALALDFEANAKYGIIYVPDSIHAPYIVAHYVKTVDSIPSIADKVAVARGFHNTDELLPSADLVFTRRLVVYTPHLLSLNEKAQLAQMAARASVYLVLRDAIYVEERSKSEKPRAFISHDTRDKEPFVRELAAMLQRMLCPVWYDEYSLVPGTSLRESIEEGLRDCAKCILVLSPHFLSNSGWTKAEFDSVFTRELVEKRNVMVPIWHGVTKEDVYRYSPRLLDRVGIASSLGPEEVARRVVRSLVD